MVIWKGRLKTGINGGTGCHRPADMKTKREMAEINVNIQWAKSNKL